MTTKSITCSFFKYKRTFDEKKRPKSHHLGGTTPVMPGSRPLSCTAPQHFFPRRYIKTRKRPFFCRNIFYLTKSSEKRRFASFQRLNITYLTWNFKCFSFSSFSCKNCTSKIKTFLNLNHRAIIDMFKQHEILLFICCST